MGSGRRAGRYQRPRPRSPAGVRPSSSINCRTRRSMSSRTGRTAVVSRPAGSVVPGFVAFAGEDRVGIAAAHGDHDVGGPDGFVGPGFGELVGDVDASFGHGGDCGGVDLVPFYPGKRYEDWVLDDPAGKDVAAVRPIRDEIRRRVEALLDELVPAGQS